MSIVRLSVRTCPVAEGTRGLVKIQEDVLADLLGAVKEESDKGEFAVLLLGVVEDKKYLKLRVNELYVPDQWRERGRIFIPDNYKAPEDVADRLIGVFHNHPGVHGLYKGEKRVAFSGMDMGPKGLNRRYRLSIVGGLSVNYDVPHVAPFGMDYHAMGRFMADCGAWLTVEYDIAPCDEKGRIDRQWPLTRDVKKPVLQEEYPHLGDCSKYKPMKGGTRYFMQRRSKCGLTETKQHAVHEVYGSSGMAIVHALPEVLPEKWKDNYTFKRDDY